MAEHTTSIDSRRRWIEDLVLRIEGEFVEDPELKLTVPDAQRRFGVDAITCEAVLDALVDASVLFKTRDRVYGRYVPNVVAA